MRRGSFAQAQQGQWWLVQAEGTGRVLEGVWKEGGEGGKEGVCVVLNRFLICFVRAAWTKIEFERARVMLIRIMIWQISENICSG